MSSKPNIISIKNFSFKYEGSAEGSLCGVNLIVQQGEFLVLSGPSGCGKTTLTRCFNGLIPDFYEGNLDGNCHMHGLDIASHETSDYSSHVGSVFQDTRSQFFTLHVKTEIPFPSENLGTPMQEIQRSYQKTVDDFELYSLLNKSIFHLSSGEKQKIAIASVKTAGVSTYVLDEPSANLDQEGTEQLRQVLAALKNQGHTIIISEHKLYYLKDLADRILVLEQGEIVHTLTGREFRSMPSTWFTDNGLRQINLDSIMPAPVTVKSPTDGGEIRAEGLSFGYSGSKTLWKNVSFECRAGDIVGIVGKNGTGKSTLIRVLMGLEKTGVGKVYLNGKYASKKQRQKQSFYVMQDVDYQLFAPTVLEEMLSGHDKNTATEQKAKEILNEFDLSGFLAVHPSQLSGGQKQRLSIALALMSKKPFIFLDEPTSGLDAFNMKKVQQAIRRLAASGACVFVITHDYEFAADVFTSLLVMKENTVTYFNSDTYQSEHSQQYFNLQEDFL